MQRNTFENKPSSPLIPTRYFKKPKDPAQRITTTELGGKPPLPTFTFTESDEDPND